jgi:hypothetical protein
MRLRPLSAILSVGCSVLLVSSAWAATIEPGQGDLTINQGTGFQPVNSRVDAKVGDSVMVGPGGAATVTYSDGCQVAVQPGAVTEVAPLSPCASGSYAQDQGGNSILPVVVGVGAAAALGFGAYGIYKVDHSSNPASP